MKGFWKWLIIMDAFKLTPCACLSSRKPYPDWNVSPRKNKYICCTFARRLPFSFPSSTSSFSNGQPLSSIASQSSISTITHRSLPRMVFLPATAIALVGTLLSIAAAQAPVASYAMAYIAVGEEVLYIHGGTADGGLGGINQFFSLDLTQKTWNTSNPPWKSLPMGTGVLSSPSAWEHTMALSKDKQSLIIYDSTPTAPGVSVFNIVNGTWQQKHALPSNPLASDYYGLRSAVDPSSGLMYIPTGTKDNQTLAYDPDSGSSSMLPNPEASIMNPVVVFYSVVWSTVRNSVIMYGGRGITLNNIVPNPYLAEIVPGPSAAWHALVSEITMTLQACHDGATL